MARRPTDYVNRSQLSLNVSQRWEQNYPTYQVNFTNKEDFGILSRNFHDKASENASQDVLKQGNTARLKNINTSIRRSSPRLKEYIRDAYSENIESVYVDYGLEKIGGAYTFPYDNDRLMQQLNMLLSKLQEPNNPIANRNQGLLYWKTLIANHAKEWSLSKKMKSDKAQIAQECKDYYNQTGIYLSKLFRQIAIDFPKEQVASVRRSFGFLDETYK